MNLNVYRINHDQIVDDVNLPSAIRLLAAKLKRNPMMPVGNFFSNLSDEELEGLRELSLEPDAAAAELLLLTMMLSAAEGTSALTEEELNSHIACTVIFISTTVLNRQGYVTAHFENFSYGSDMIDAHLATPTGLGLEYIRKLQGNDDER